MKNPTNPWIGLARTAQNQALRLVIFPFAGGSAASFYRWLKDFPYQHEVAIDIIQLPGRGGRTSEPFMTDLSQISECLLPLVKGYVEQGPCIFFGYSMGAMLAFDLTVRLKRQYNLSPSRVIVAARKSPKYNPSGIRRGGMNQEQMIRQLQRLGGTPQELLDNPKLYQYYFDVLVADFQAVENYQIDEIMIDTPIVVIGGVDDGETSLPELHDWRRFTSCQFDLHLLPGQHFFLNTSYQALVELVANYTLDYVLQSNQIKMEAIC